MLLLKVSHPYRTIALSSGHVNAVIPIVSEFGAAITHALTWQQAEMELLENLHLPHLTVQMLRVTYIYFSVYFAVAHIMFQYGTNKT